MKPSNFLSILLAIIVAVLGYKLTVSQTSSEASVTKSDTYETIMTRTSVRKFTEQLLSSAQIDTLLHAGMAAPSAVDLRPWEFVVIQDKKLQGAIADRFRSATPARNAGAVIMVCGNMNKVFKEAKEYWTQDCSAVMENMLLAAHGMGLGAVWLGVYPQVERCEQLKEMFNIPDSIQPFGLMAVGYPAETPEPKDKWDASLVSYNTYGNKDNGESGKTTTVQSDKANSFKEWNIEEELRVNPFSFYRQPGGLVLCAGNKEKSNAMAIGWGTLGTLWQQSIATVYVAEQRYTHEFMESSDYFTIMNFDDKKVLDVMGQKSGRDIDKAKECGLHILYTDNGTPYYQEAKSVIECKIMYSAPFDAKKFKDEVPQKLYTDFPGGIHTEYVGKIVKAMKK